MRCETPNFGSLLNSLLCFYDYIAELRYKNNGKYLTI